MIPTLAGAASGAAGFALLLLLAPRGGSQLAAAAAVLLWVILSRGPRSIGITAVTLSFLIRWQALAHLAAPPLTALIAAQAVPRAARAALAYTARPLEPTSITARQAFAAIVAGLACAAPAGARFGWFAVSASTLLVVIARQICEARYGGVNARMLDALEQTAECVILTGAACRSCIW